MMKNTQHKALEQTAVTVEDMGLTKKAVKPQEAEVGHVQHQRQDNAVDGFDAYTENAEAENYNYKEVVSQPATKKSMVVYSRKAQYEAVLSARVEDMFSTPLSLTRVIDSVMKQAENFVAKEVSLTEVEDRFSAPLRPHQVQRDGGQQRVQRQGGGFGRAGGAAQVLSSYPEGEEVRGGRAAGRGQVHHEVQGEGQEE